MMLQVCDVIADEILERNGLGLWNRLERDLIAVVAGSWARSLILGNALDNVCKVVIVGAPQGKQRQPVGLGVVLHPDPRLLVIAGKREVLRELRANEASVIVRGRVHEMA